MTLAAVASATAARRRRRRRESIDPSRRIHTPARVTSQTSAPAMIPVAAAALYTNRRGVRRVTQLPTQPSLPVLFFPLPKQVERLDGGERFDLRARELSQQFPGRVDEQRELIA